MGWGEKTKKNCCNDLAEKVQWGASREALWREIKLLRKKIDDLNLELFNTQTELIKERSSK